jgi:hypothetical protein
VLPRAERREPEPWGHAVAPELPRAGRRKAGAGITGTRSGLGTAPYQEVGVGALGHAGMRALSFVLSLYAGVSGLQGTDNSHFYSARVQQMAPKRNHILFIFLPPNFDKKFSLKSFMLLGRFPHSNPSLTTAHIKTAIGHQMFCIFFFIV